jgi:hypothetical protein
MEETINTSGFYKNDNGELLYGPNFVLNKDYELRAENKDQYTYPVDGWSWFESEEEATSSLSNG